MEPNNMSFLIVMIIVGFDLIACQNNGYPRLDQSALGGLVDVDVHNTLNGGKHVGVHVPAFYSMDLDKERGRTGLGISVLDGLVKVRVNRNNRKKKGVLVALADIPLWDSRK